MNRIQAINNLCKQFKIEQDIYDFKAEWDSSLSVEENYTLLFDKLKVFTKEFTKADIENAEQTAKEIRKELDKILERLRGYGCGYHKQLERQILNLKKKFKEEKNNEDT